MADDKIQQAQDRLGATMDKARAGEDRELARWIREDGLRFAQTLTGLLRLIRIHDLANQAFDTPVTQFIDASRMLYERLGAIHLVAVEDQVYVNDIRLRFEDRGEGPTLAQLMRVHGVGGISFHTVMTDDEVRQFTWCFAQKPAESMARLALAKLLEDKGLATVQVFGVFRFRMAGDNVELREEAGAVILERTRGAVAEAWNNMGHGRLPNPLPLRRAITEILERGVDGTELWEESNSADRHGAHSSRVARLALLIGRGLGLSEAQLQDLGVAAIFHDIGYAAREGADPKNNEPGYPPPFERHGAAGARLLLKQRGFHEARIHRLLAVLEHHEDYDSRAGKPSLFGRVLRIAEDYDNLCYSEECRYCPAMALSYMAGKVGRAYDPLLLQILINGVGCYPPGTLLRLADGREVRSNSLVRSPETFNKPLCVATRMASGADVAGNVEVDLAKEGQVLHIVA